MCGISAIFGSAGVTDAAAIDRMVAAISHRGPDGQRVMRMDGCHLGHARLSIIDLDGGSQPMRDISRRYAVTFNGEIYNYKEIRRELEKRNHSFATSSDTEVILNAFAEWGPKCLDRLRGMFAFAIWDKRERSLFAARDLFGEKPLYYASTANGQLLLASEIKALLASHLLHPVVDRKSVDAFLAFGYVPPDRTIYANVRTLPPGHWLVWKAGEVKTERYWCPRFDPRPIGLNEAAERLTTLLEQAVQRETVADVPVGAFLSGGHDSSTIVALMQTQSAHPVKTFSVGFGDYINELPYARAVAQQYGTEHHEIDLGTPRVAELLERMVEVYDEPFHDPSHIPTYLIAQYARQHVKVVLSGDGADELFGGYSWYPLMAASTEVAASWLKWTILRGMSRLVGNRLSRLDRYSHAMGLALRYPLSWMRYVSERTTSEAVRRAWWSRPVDPYVPGSYYRPPNGTSGMDQILYFDLVSFLPGDILVKVDRAAMAHGLETRAPFLDRDLVEFALTLPSTLKVDDDKTKLVFKRACAQYWPEALHKRGKQGFAAPFRTWLGLPDVAALVKRVFRDGSKLRELLPGISCAQQTRSDYETWCLLTFGLWLERQNVGDAA